MSKPTVFALDEADIKIILKPDEVFEPVLAPPAPKRKLHSLFWSALAGLISLVILTSLYSFIENMFIKAPWLGWVAAGVTAVLLLTSIVVMWREFRALRQLKRVGQWHETPVVSDIYVHLKTMPACSRGLLLYEQAVKGQIIDDADKLILLERVLVQSDATSLALIAQASKRVSMVTALSPKAIVDIAMVGFTLVTLLRRIAEIYGLRPGTLAGFKLMRLAFTHLAVTAGLAAGDTIISQFLGAGIAGRLSAKLGEGVVNGLLTARFGIAAQAICRPLVFKELNAPKLSEVVSGFIGKN
jgi:putative membrane protein